MLDASVALRWFLDASPPAYAVRVRNLLLSGNQALVPSLWHLEVANALVIAERRRSLDSAELDRSLQRIEQLLTIAIQTDSEFVPVRQASKVARSFSLSAYDASYLFLAERKGLPLATLDHELSLAAHASGVEIV